MEKSSVALTGLFLFCLILGSASASADDNVRYLKSNIHAQEQNDRGGTKICKASYANWTEPGEGHFIVPVNTKVEFSITRGLMGRRLVIKNLSDGKLINFELHLKRMGVGSIDEYVGLISSPNPVSMSGLSKLDKKGISEGRAYVGMTKDGIRMALGYPAAHKTPSLDAPKWIYWKNRYTTKEIEFGTDGRVKFIR